MTQQSRTDAMDTRQPERYPESVTSSLPPPPPYPPSDNGYPSSRHSSMDHGQNGEQQQRPHAATGSAAIPPMPVPMPMPPPPQSKAARPYHDAVSSALGQHQVPGISQQDLVDQITRSVLQQLRGEASTSGANGSTQASSAASSQQQQSSQQPYQPSHYQQPAQSYNYAHSASAGTNGGGGPLLAQPVPMSPSAGSGTSPPMFTPPSPQKHFEQRRPSDERDGAAGDAASSQLQPQPQSQSQSQQSQQSQAQSQPQRPRGPTKVDTASDATTLEKIWGTLFDEDGQPTARLGQFLRGLAVHLIEDFEPKHSLVVTPGKMIAYYDKVKVGKETYPWADIFDDAQSSISRMYRALRIPHHLVQDPARLDERPDIPGLIPAGFARWATLVLQAHPDAEFERLQAATRNLPVDNPDNARERFPKDVSRRLFPAQPDRRLRDQLVAAIEEHAQLDLDQPETPQPQPQPAQQPQQQQQQAQHPAHERLRTSPGAEAHSRHNSAPDAGGDGGVARPSAGGRVASNVRRRSIDSDAGYFERQRQPYSSVPPPAAGGSPPHGGGDSQTSYASGSTTTAAASAIHEGSSGPEDESAPPTPLHQPIERERKPYSAQPGQGRVIEDVSPERRAAPAPAPVPAPAPIYPDEARRSAAPPPPASAAPSEPRRSGPQHPAVAAAVAQATAALPMGASPHAPSAPPKPHQQPPPPGPPPGAAPSAAGGGSSVHRSNSTTGRAPATGPPPTTQPAAGVGHRRSNSTTGRPSAPGAPPAPSKMPAPHAAPSTQQHDLYPAHAAGNAGPVPPPQQQHPPPPQGLPHRSSTSAANATRPRAPTGGTGERPSFAPPPAQARNPSPASSMGGSSAAGERYTPVPAPPMGGNGGGGGGEGRVRFEGDGSGYRDDEYRRRLREDEYRRDGGAGGEYRGGSPQRRYDDSRAGGERRAPREREREREYADEEFYRRRPEERRW